MAFETKPLSKANDRAHRTEVTPDTAQKDETDEHDGRPPETEKGDTSEIRIGVLWSKEGSVECPNKETGHQYMDSGLNVLVREEKTDDPVICEC